MAIVDAPPCRAPYCDGIAAFTGNDVNVYTTAP
jgi:hypothetical protein